MPIPLTALFDRIAPETQSIVDQTRQRFSQAIRSLLRAETRLQMGHVVTTAIGNEQETRSVRIFVTPGMPMALLSMSFDENLWLAIELAPLAGLLETTQRSMGALHDPIESLANREEFRAQFPQAPDTIQRMRDLATALLHEAGKFDLLRRIFAINEDVLGLYSYRSSPDRPVFDEEDPSNGSGTPYPPNARIDIYWVVIGLTSKILGVSVEALTVYVLAHKLGHAYTHIGADANGTRWNDQGFASSERALTEGLAQYYAVRALERLERRIPEARIAHDRMLSILPDPYHAHRPWLEDCKPEEVRDAMRAVRRIGIGTLQAFNDALFYARRRMRNN